MKIHFHYFWIFIIFSSVYTTSKWEIRDIFETFFSDKLWFSYYSVLNKYFQAIGLLLKLNLRSGYTNKVMNKLKKEKDQVEKQNEELKQWCSQICADEEDLEDDNDDSVIHSNTDNITEVCTSVWGNSNSLQ